MSREKKEENSLEKKYFILGGCFSTERPIHRSRENKQENSFEKIFHFGRVFWY